MLLALICLVVPTIAQGADDCSIEAVRRAPDQIVPILERMKRMNCDLDKVLDELKQQNPEAWALLQKDAISRLPPSDLFVTVKGRQCGWLFEYHGSSAGESRPQVCTIQGPMVLPRGKRIELIVTSDDVIHDLSIPALGGSVSAVPGRLSTLLFDTSKAGAFKGGTTRTSGPKYAEMEIEVRVLEPVAFVAWEQVARRTHRCPAL